MKKELNWAWQTPEYNSPTWDKVDSVIDNGLATAFDNKAGNALVNIVDFGIMKLEQFGAKLENYFKKESADV